MNRKLAVPIELLHSLLVLDAQEGRLFWRSRTEDMFAGQGWQRARACKTWNTRFAGKEAASPTTQGYLRVSINGVLFKAHRIIFAMSNGRWPDGDVDHVNGDTSDNRPSNLREVDHCENCRNQSLRVTNKTGQMGVRLDPRRGKFTATINDHGERRHIGSFETMRDAVSARRAAERALNYHSNHGRNNA